MSSTETMPREAAIKAIRNLPPTATWAEIRYAIYATQQIEAGLKDSREGNTVPMAEILAEFGGDDA